MKEPRQCGASITLQIFGLLIGILAGVTLYDGALSPGNSGALDFILGLLCAIASLGLFASASIIDRLDAVAYFLRAAHIRNKEPK